MWLPWLIVLSSLFSTEAPYKTAIPTHVVNHPPSQWVLGGIELGDNENQVHNVWGIPIKVEVDEWQMECETWRFKEGKNLGMCEGHVSFVQVTAQSSTTSLDGETVEMDAVHLRQALGTPQFIAEDGWGFLRGNEALKVFVDEHGKLISIDLFTDSNNG